MITWHGRGGACHAASLLDPNPLDVLSASPFQALVIELRGSCRHMPGDLGGAFPNSQRCQACGLFSEGRDSIRGRANETKRTEPVSRHFLLQGLEVPPTPPVQQCSIL